MPDVFISEDNKPDIDKPAEQLTAAQAVHDNSLPFLTSFCYNPKGINFKNQEPDEYITLFLRRHFINNISWISIGLLMLILPVFLTTPFNVIGTIQSVIPLKFIIIVIFFYYLIVLGYMFVNFVTWFYNVGILTTKQIIDIDFTDLMYREVAKARIQDVIDVEFTQGGFLHSFFDYGNVYIQTEGVKPNFEFLSVPQPDKITDIILDLKGEKPND